MNAEISETTRARILGLSMQKATILGLGMVNAEISETIRNAEISETIRSWLLRFGMS